MFREAQNILQSLVVVKEKELLGELIQQLNKGFNLSGIDFQIDEKVSPRFLINQLTEIVSILIGNDFQKFMNFLYRIDVSENKLIKIKEVDVQIISQKVTLLILKKEWQKVWFRNKS